MQFINFFILLRFFSISSTHFPLFTIVIKYKPDEPFFNIRTIF